MVGGTQQYKGSFKQWKRKASSVGVGRLSKKHLPRRLLFLLRRRWLARRFRLALMLGFRSTGSMCRSGPAFRSRMFGRGRLGRPGFRFCHPFTFMRRGSRLRLRGSRSGVFRLGRLGSLRFGLRFRARCIFMCSCLRFRRSCGRVLRFCRLRRRLGLGFRLRFRRTFMGRTSMGRRSMGRRSSFFRTL